MGGRNLSDFVNWREKDFRIIRLRLTELYLTSLSGVVDYMPVKSTDNDAQNIDLYEFDIFYETRVVDLENWSTRI